MVEKLKPNKIGKMTQTSSDHKIADVKQTDSGKVGRNNTIRMKKKIDATSNSPISCLKLRFLAISLMTYLLFIH